MTRVSLGGRSAGVLLSTALCVLGGFGPVWAQADAERLRTAKTLFFDRKYAEARQAWEAVRAAAKGVEAEAPAYWVARCSENLGESERALKEYDAFLALRPKDRALVEEARTSRVSLAAKLYKAGNKAHVQVLREALSDASRTVRYYAALQMSGLDAEMGKLAAPVLRQILEQEKDADLVDRAKLGLMRWDPSALSATPSSGAPRATASARTTAPATAGPRAARGREAHWVHVRITEKGGTKPKVSINLPLGLAEMLFKSLPEDAKADLKREGYDPETFWVRLRQLGPSEIISIEGDDGERIQIWTEE
jgi:tetratricopeptide (TPR) repeat protein